MENQNDLKTLNDKVGLDIKKEPTGPGKSALLMSINNKLEVIAKAVEDAIDNTCLNHTKYNDEKPLLSDIIENQMDVKISLTIKKTMVQLQLK